MLPLKFNQRHLKRIIDELHDFFRANTFVIHIILISSK